MEKITLLHGAVLTVLACESERILAGALEVRAVLAHLDRNLGGFFQRIPKPPEEGQWRAQVADLARRIPSLEADVASRLEGLHSGAMHLLMLATIDVAFSIFLGASSQSALGMTGAVVATGFLYGNLAVTLSQRLRAAAARLNEELLRLGFPPGRPS